MSELTPENELRGNLCEALGWIRGPQGWQRTEESWPSALPPLDHNLIAVAREKLLPTEAQGMIFLDKLAKTIFVEGANQTIYALLNATPTQQARAILEAVKA